MAVAELVAEFLGVMVGHSADDGGGESGEGVEASASHHHGEEAFEEGFAEAGEAFLAEDVLVDFRVELAADHVHAADARADEGAAGEGHCQIFVVDAFSVAFEDLGYLGGGALPEFFEAFFERFPG
ncbi:hypothetical protein [Winogradskya humida]|uniref:hypothetical protein n=1 Tax=Winogradskya humida TaxID=113566 RepID=UPI0031CEDDF7